MAPRFKINGINKTVAARTLVDDFISTGVEANTIRTIWYQIKHKIQPWQNGQSEKEFSDAINIIIGAHLWSRYTGGETDLYESLGIKSKAFTGGEMPVVLFCEKQLPDFDAIANELESAIYLSSGQVPNFEIAQAAKFLTTLDMPRVYLFGMVDFDPSGLSVYRSLSEKLQEALNIESENSIRLIHKLITFDDFDEYDSYMLSIRQAKKWKYGSYGIELDTVSAFHRIDMVKRSIYNSILPVDYELLSVLRARNNEYRRRLKDSEEYAQRVYKVAEFETQTQKDVWSLNYEYDADEWDIIYSGMIEGMTTLEVSDVKN